MLLRKFTIRLLIILVLVFSVSINVNAAALETTNTDFVNPEIEITKINISNFNKVDENYYRGAQPNDKGFKNLAQLGIKTIIDLRHYSYEDSLREKRIVESHGLNYVNIPMNPLKSPSSFQITSFFNVINNHEALPVFVHCWQGKDRTGVMTALYRIKNYGWGYDKAYEEMKDKGYHHFLYPAQRKFLYNYAKSVGEHSLLY